jgi:hypothetical protein
MWDLWWTKWHWAGFLRVLRFPLQIYHSTIAPYSSITAPWGVRLLWPSGTLSQPRSSVRGFTSDPAHWLETETESKVSIVSDYRLDDHVTVVQFLAEAENVSSNLCVQTSSEAHPASCPMGTGSPSPGVECGRGVTLITHLHLMPMSRMNRSCTSSTPCRLHGGSRTALLLCSYLAQNMCTKFN